MDVPITPEDHAQWVGALYVEMQSWRKAALMLEARVKALETEVAALRPLTPVSIAVASPPMAPEEAPA